MADKLQRQVDIDESTSPGRKRRPPAADSWTSLSKTLRTWDQPRLIGLLHDPFKTVPEAREAMAGRLTLDKPMSARAGTLETLRKRVRRAVIPPRAVWNINPNLKEARRIGDQYLRSTSDADGAILLYMELIDAAMELSFEFGWDESAFYDSIDRAAGAVEEILPVAVDRSALREAAERVERLLKHKNFPGWGMDECLGSLADAMQIRVSEIES